MARIILSIGDKVLREVVLSKERITIGRRPHNDVVIDHLAISGEHAVIVTRNNDSFLEDLNSTNGTQVNGQPVKKHFLQDKDVIELAQFRITYIASDSEAEQRGTSGTAWQPGVTRQAVGMIRVLNGPSAGREVALNKVLTTIGRPDVQVAVVTRREQYYYLAHVEGDCPTLLNGHAVGLEPREIADGDLIDLSGTQMKVFLP